MDLLHNELICYIFDIIPLTDKLNFSRICVICKNLTQKQLNLSVKMFETECIKFWNRFEKIETQNKTVRYHFEKN